MLTLTFGFPSPLRAQGREFRAMDLPLTADRTAGLSVQSAKVQDQDVHLSQPFGRQLYPPWVPVRLEPCPPLDPDRLRLTWDILTLKTLHCLSEVQIQRLVFVFIKSQCPAPWTSKRQGRMVAGPTILHAHSAQCVMVVCFRELLEPSGGTARGSLCHQSCFLCPTFLVGMSLCALQSTWDSSYLLQALPAAGSQALNTQSRGCRESEIGFGHISMQPSRAHVGRNRLFI